MNRRGFLGCLAGIVAAPMIVKVSTLMPVKTIESPWLYSDTVGNLFPEMQFTIEKISVTAQSRVLKATYTMELEQDLKAVYGIDLESERAKIKRYFEWSSYEDRLAATMQRELDKEIFKELTNGGINTGEIQTIVASSGTGRSMFKERMQGMGLGEPVGLAISTRGVRDGTS